MPVQSVGAVGEEKLLKSLVGNSVTVTGMIELYSAISARRSCRIQLGSVDVRLTYEKRWPD